MQYFPTLTLILTVLFLSTKAWNSFWQLIKATIFLPMLLTINVAKKAQLGGIGWPKDDKLIVHLETEVHFEKLVWLKLKTCIAKTNFIFHSIISNLPKICWVLVGPGENWDVEFPSPMRMSWNQYGRASPKWFHTKMSQVAQGIRRDECPFPNEGSLICTSRQMESFFH